MGGVSTEAGIEIYAPVIGLQKTNLIEKEEKDMHQSGRSFKIPLGKNSIETFKLNLEN
jgi:hypothetical protein